jgi:TolB-like protein/DNA-binding winged helix-turn-helix (wHTH) protein/Tfp pilus assembly protein PilF
VQLAPKAFDTLLVLVENRGRVLDKDELMGKLWPDSDVEEANLPLNISALRRALGESPNERRYIITIPGRGYRFGAQVDELDDGNDGLDLFLEKYTSSTLVVEEQELSGHDATASLPAALPATRSRKLIVPGLTGLAALIVVAAVLWGLLSKKTDSQPEHPVIKSLAVLPFKHLGPQTSEYLGPGMADSLITRLSNLREIKVRPTSSILKYVGQTRQPAEIGKELGVEALLEGSIQNAGDDLRVTVQLVRVEDGSPLWAEKFDERFTDILKIEDSISERVARRLVLKLTGEEREALTRPYTESTEAYRLYLKGRYQWNKATGDTIRKGIEYFQQATEKDASYALAFAGLSDAYSMLPMIGDVAPREAFPKAKEAAARALAIDDRLAEAHASMGYIRFFFDWDWPSAESELERSIQINPNYALGRFCHAVFLSSTGRPDAAIMESRRALELDPLSLRFNALTGQFLFQAHKYDQAEDQAQKALETEPSFWITHIVLGKVYLQKAMYSEALIEFQKARQLSGGNTEATSLMGYTYATSGDRTQAQKMLAELKERSGSRYMSAYNIALVHLGIGERNQALDWLDKAYQDRDVRMVLLGVDPKWEVLGSEPRFTALLQRMKL